MRRTFTTLLLFLSALSPAMSQLNVPIAVELGRQCLSRDEFEKAITRFDEVLAVRPQNAMVYYYRGYARFSLGQYEEAESDCTTAIRYNPFHAEFRQLRGLCRINRNDYTGAIVDYDSVLMETPRDQNSLYNRALCYVKLKDYDRALPDINLIAQLWPKMSRIYLLRAQIELEKEHFAMADSLLTKAITYGNRQADNFVVRAQARHALLRYNEALADYDMAISLSPSHFVAHYNRGLLRSMLGADNEAIEDFDFVLQQEPHNTLALYNRALLREKVGMWAEAEEDFSVLIDSFPNFYAGYAARARLRRKQGKTLLARTDETVVRRADLDLTFGTQKKHPLRRVRQREEEDLERYQDLIENE